MNTEVKPLELPAGSVYLVVTPGETTGFTLAIYNLLLKENFDVLALVRGLAELASTDTDKTLAIGQSAFQRDLLEIQKFNDQQKAEATTEGMPEPEYVVVNEQPGSAALPANGTTGN